MGYHGWLGEWGIMGGWVSGVSWVGEWGIMVG